MKNILLSTSTIILLLGSVEASAFRPSKKLSDDSSLVRSVALIGTRLGNCTASVISPDLLITAAHCFGEEKGVNDDLAQSFAYFGKLAPKKGRSERSFRVKAVRVHPSYDGKIQYVKSGPEWGFLANDIALVQIELHEGFQPEPVKIASSIEAVGKGSVLLGVGTGPMGGISIPNQAKVRVRRYSAEMGKYEVSFFNNGSFTRGDSGGPAYATIDNELLLIGVVSGSTTYESVARHLEWIKMEAKALGSSLSF